MSPPTPAPPPSPPRSACRRGWSVALLALALATVAGAILVRGLQPFLAPVRPVAGGLVVLEGWLPDYAIQEGLAQLRPDSHERVFATGGPLPRGDYLSDYGSYAAVAAATAIRLGLSSNQVSAVPSGAVYRNRTFASALALRDYCRSNGVVVDKLNLVSLGAHARRSQLCFQRAFGADVDIGILAIENREYDPRRWWRFSQGIKEVGGESLAWAYAWLSLDYGD